MRPKLIAAIVVFSMVSVLVVAGCTSTTTNKTSPSPATTDYSSHFNAVWNDVVIEKTFVKGTNERGNTIYTGVIRGVDTRYPNTVIEELVASKGEAANLYNNAVAKARSDGYVYRAFSTAPNSDIEARWRGDLDSKFFYTDYHFDDTVNSWVFERQYA
jgi:hypothetical protein